MKNISNQNGFYLATEVEKAQWEKDHTLVCPICGKTFIGYGNNPYPIMKDGSCCDDCNLWVILMRMWLDSNHDLLKGMVDKLHRRSCTVTSSYCINGKKGAFTFYRDLETKKLDVVVACDDEYCEKVVTGTLRNWITNNYSDMNLEDVREMSKVGVWKVTNDIKIKEETECDEVTVIATTSNEIFERLEKVFENIDFQVDIDNSMPETNSTITISRMYDNSYEEILIDFFDMSDYCCANISGGYDDECFCCEESVRWNPENDDVDDIYEDIKNAVSTVYAGITECRMREMFNKKTTKI